MSTTQIVRHVTNFCVLRHRCQDLGDGAEARAVFLFVHSGSVILDLSTGLGGGDVAHAYVDKMFILLDGRTLSATVTGADASGSVYDLIIGG